MEKDLKKAVREGYAKIAEQGRSCCGPVSSCCGSADTAQEISRNIGYSDGEIASVPDGSVIRL